MRKAVCCVAFGLTLFAGIAASQTASVLHVFTDDNNDGTSPSGSLVLDSAGNLYGTTSWGGIFGSGIVYELTPVGDGTWTEAVLYNFSGGTDGGFPEAGLVFDSSGILYGTTASGGDTSCQGGCGVVFRLSPQPHGKWEENVLYRFVRNGRDGFTPVTNVVFDESGNLYGTTKLGGAYNQGIVYRLIPRAQVPWKEEKLHVFNGTDGAAPSAVTVDSAGNVYGTSSVGGRGCGTVFQLTPGSHSGWKAHSVYGFAPKNGCGPASGVIFDTAGNLYGTTVSGGTGQCFRTTCGVVFKLTAQSDGKWSETVLYSFATVADGLSPGGLTFDIFGNLYGVTAGGGTAAFASGTVFRLNPNPDGSWAHTVLYNLDTHSGICNPSSSLVLDVSGNAYGTAISTCAGVAYEISP